MPSASASSASAPNCRPGEEAAGKRALPEEGASPPSAAGWRPRPRTRPERERQEKRGESAPSRKRVRRRRAGVEQEQLDGRAVLASFVATYGKVDEFKGIAGQISAFLDKARKVKPCPPA